MPEQIVQQVKAIPGVRLVGEETANGRTVVKYAYSGAANTQNAGRNGQRPNLTYSSIKKPACRSEARRCRNRRAAEMFRV